MTYPRLVNGLGNVEVMQIDDQNLGSGKARSRLRTPDDWDPAAQCGGKCPGHGNAVREYCVKLRSEMIQLGNTKIFVGTREDSQLRANPDWAVVNTAKTVHVAVKGWSNAPPRDHPDYLAFEDGQFLSFNWVDGAARMYEWSGPQAFIRALDFIDKWYLTKEILVNCDLGQSRSPTVALLYLSKRLHLVPDDTFAHARAAFQALYPGYAPSGIADYVAAHWAEIN